jgi:magnesium-transporting ATPase (P-type)
MSKQLVKPPASAYSKPSSKRGRKGSEWYFFIQILIVIVLAILALTVAARAFGWDMLTDEVNMIAMINDDGAIVRGVVMLAVLVVLLFVVGKPAQRPWWLKMDRIMAALAFAAIIGVMYWFAWGGGYVP